MNGKLPMVGNPNQLMKTRRIMFRDGMSRDVQAIEVHNESGLYLTCIEDQCLNLFDFSFKGLNLAFQSKNGLVSNRFFNVGCGEFGHYWPAGMMYTCGLSNTGPAVVEDGNYYAEHGRIGMMPAENVSVTHAEDGICISGSVRESAVCGRNLELKRSIFVPSCGKEIRFVDEITNLEPQSAGLMYLYHFNFGYPFLDPGCRVVKGAGKILDLAGDGTIPDNWDQVEEPKDHKTEELYCHENTPDEDGWGWAALINDRLGLGVYVKYDMASLPLLVHWKNMCTHDYCVGLEPSNSYIKGRIREREQGTLAELAGYESRTFRVSFGILEGAEEIRRFEERIAACR